jgi:uncharacterized protein
MSSLKDTLHADLTTAMKARDELTTATLRMLLTAVSTEEVSGTAARELSDDEVITIVNREAKKRREAADAFAAAGRGPQAEREVAEGTVLARYLPAQLDDEQLTALVADAIAETGAAEIRQLGQVMKLASAKVAKRADGKRVSDEVRRQLSS